MTTYPDIDSALAAVAANKGCQVDDLDFIPDPKDGSDVYYISFGPADEDVVAVRVQD